MKSRLFLSLALFSQAQAQPSGPIVRSLGNNYFLVQCNAVKLKADDTVSVMRQGCEVGTAKVMREDASVCSILLSSGQAQRLDLVVLTRSKSTPADRGPSLPVMLFGTQRAPVTTDAKKGGSANYFNSINTTGTVYNLNTGEYLTKP